MLDAFEWWPRHRCWPANRVAFIEAFAAGAILTMLADSMMPEAFENAAH